MISVLASAGVRLKGGNNAGAVAGVDAGLFDVLHDGTDDGRFAVAEMTIDIDLGGVFEEAVDEDGMGLGDDGFVRGVGVAGGSLLRGITIVHGRAHVGGELDFVIDDLHGAATEHEAGADEAGEIQRGLL